MEEEEDQISYGGGEVTFPDSPGGEVTFPDSPREESPRWLSHGTELAVFDSLCPQPNRTVHFLPEFDPNYQFECIAENSPVFRYQLQDLNPRASSDGTMPLLGSPSQSDASTSSDPPPSLVASEWKEQPWRQKFVFRSQKHEPQPHIGQVVNHSSFHPVVPEAGLQTEMELPSDQSHHGIMSTFLWADQQDQMVGMNRLSSFRFDETGNQMSIIISEPSQISHSNCSAFVIHGSQRENTDCSIDGVLSNDRTGKRIRTFEEDITQPFYGSALSLACLPSDYSSALPLQAMPVQQVSAAKKQKREIGGSGEASAAPRKAPAFYNFLGLPHDVYAAERDAYANQYSNGWGDYDVDLELKL